LKSCAEGSLETRCQSTTSEVMTTRAELVKIVARVCKVKDSDDGWMVVMMRRCFVPEVGDEQANASLTRCRVVLVVGVGCGATTTARSTMWWRVKALPAMPS